MITVTHNEVLRGAVAKSSRVRECIARATESGRWLFGVHVQGDCSYLPKWPAEPWQAFIMWPDPSAGFLAGVASAQIVPYNCVNFLPETVGILSTADRPWDLCIVSRAATIKRIFETLRLVQLVLNRRPSLRVTFIVPDPRVLRHGIHTYERDGVDRRYFELPLKMFTARQLRQLSFVSPSTESFGSFPLAHDLVQTVLAKSKFLLLTSHSEGTPRAIGEALLVGTPCMVSAQLRSGMAGYLKPEATVVLHDDDLEIAAKEVVSALDTHDQFQVDTRSAQDAFSDRLNRPRLVSRLTEIITAAGSGVDGEWVLEDLHLRLCGHGRKRSVQFMDGGELFVRWFADVETADPYDEDRLASLEDGPGDGIQTAPGPLVGRVRQALRNAARRARV